MQSVCPGVSVDLQASQRGPGDTLRPQEDISSLLTCVGSAQAPLQRHALFKQGLSHQRSLLELQILLLVSSPLCLAAATQGLAW